MGRSDSFDKVVAALQHREDHISDKNREAATVMHELFLVLQSGGFTEDQALKIVAHRIAAAGDDTPPPEGA